MIVLLPMKDRSPPTLQHCAKNLHSYALSCKGTWTTKPSATRPALSDLMTVWRSTAPSRVSLPPCSQRWSCAQQGRNPMARPKVMPELVLRNLGHGLLLLTLLSVLQKMKLNTQERYVVAETLRDAADELENPDRRMLVLR